jgi:hypothetical protein
LGIQPLAVLLDVVATVAPEQVESVEPWLATPEQQVFELRFAMAVEARDFAIEDADRARSSAGRFSASAGKNLNWLPFREISRHFAFVDVCQRPEAVPLDLKKPFWMGVVATTEPVAK